MTGATATTTAAAASDEVDDNYDPFDDRGPPLASGINREAGGQGEFSVGLAARRDVASPTSKVALKKAARSWEEPMR
jgi:hypothetical protein